VYCTYLTVYRGNKMPPFYIGYARKSRLDKGYRGSVSSKQYKEIWKTELAQNPHLFRTFVIGQHATKDEAIKRERYFHLRLNVLGDMYINQSITTDTFFVANRTQEHTKAIIESRRGYKHSNDTKAKISSSKTGQVYLDRRGIEMPDETKEKISQRLKGRKLSKSTREKMSQSRTGSKHSDETIQKMRKPKSDIARKNMRETYYSRNEGKIIINNGITEKYVDPDMLDAFIIEGWHKGRIGKHTPPSQKGKIWVNNGTQSAMAWKDDIPNGWNIGRLKKCLSDM